MAGLPVKVYDDSRMTPGYIIDVFRWRHKVFVRSGWEIMKSGLLDTKGPSKMLTPAGKYLYFNAT